MSTNSIRMDLLDCLSLGWPPSSLEIEADSIYRRHASNSHLDLINECSSCIDAIRRRNIHKARPKREVVKKHIEETLIRAIYGSNLIEGAGHGNVITSDLCRKVFAGDHMPVVINVGSSDQILPDLRSQQQDLESMPAPEILRRRNEVIQHAKAYQHIMKAFVVEKRYLDESLIKETHKILTLGVPIIQKDFPDVPPEKYGGIYRTIQVSAGDTNFTVPKFVPAKMKEMCEELREEFTAAEIKGSIDPISVATKYSLTFVMIHPFRDGNGRMCRMILNAILCRYAGITVPIGEMEQDKTEYIDIKKKASAEMEGHGEYAIFVLKKAVTQLHELKEQL